MKKYLLIFTLAALTASPVLAVGRHAKNVKPEDAFAYAPPTSDVVAYGKDLGRDPDPRIRAELLRLGDISNLAGGEGGQ